MKLIVDSNIIISALLKSGTTRELILCNELYLYIPDYVLKEIKNHIPEFIKKTSISKEKLELLIYLITEDINIINSEYSKKYEEYSKKIMKDIDINDFPILAAALSVKNDGIWSEDKHFLKQNIVKIWKTKEIIEFVKKK